ncbi:hypothetical protein [Mycetocola sp. JXN-3]|uniref:hypothetical protein n=1 Tax=Mycetocola sp. JXN-3 TaxID=2116510 RepID=UPI00165D1B01|nr:hypothetical protein [Mycetocola sp. JXN-3]
MADVQKLIAEARAFPDSAEDEPPTVGEVLISRLADALEAATSLVGEKQNRANPDLDLVLPSPVEPAPVAGVQDDWDALRAEAERRIPPNLMHFPNGETLDLQGHVRAEFIAGAIWAGSRPVGRKTEYRAHLGPVVGEARVSPKHAIMACQEALDAYPWVFEGDDQAPTVYSRQVTLWTPVSPEQDGGKA